MLRKLFAIVFCLGVLLGSASAMAAGQTGTIGIQLGSEGEVTLYRVGDLSLDGYRLLERYGGRELTFDEVISSDVASLLAQEAAEGKSQRASEGLVTFRGLEQGIYLLVQTECAPGSYPFSPFLVTIPWEGDQWDLQAKPKAYQDTLPRTGQEMGLFLAMGMMLASTLGMLGCTMAERRKAE